MTEDSVNSISEENPLQRLTEMKRAEAAWGAIKNLKKTNCCDTERYGKLARSAAADIQSFGLGETLAFWNAKGRGNESYYLQLLNDVSSWLKNSLKLDTDNILEWIIFNADTSLYRMAKFESIAFLIWLKRFAEAEL